MKVLVCGSRHFNDYDKLKEVLDDYWISHIIHGAARGTDSLAGRYGKEMDKPVSEFVAEWDKYGRRAGPIRNIRMLQEGLPDMVIAFLAPNSRGTRHMIEIAQKAGVETKVIDI